MLIMWNQHCVYKDEGVQSNTKKGTNKSAPLLSCIIVSNVSAHQQIFHKTIRLQFLKVKSGRYYNLTWAQVKGKHLSVTARHYSLLPNSHMVTRVCNPLRHPAPCLQCSCLFSSENLHCPNLPFISDLSLTPMGSQWCLTNLINPSL